ncbi:uncharacterized protein BN693_01767 [Prevotella sp. CAG:5226]|nr:uncharacterized protein BN693_01767 [Prevotella sp. CAG:5226]
MEGTLERFHSLGLEISISLFEFSKSSMYEALPCAPLLLPAMSWANSAEKLMLDGVVQCMNGNLLSQSVRRWLCFFHDRLSPHNVLLSGSAPIETFVVMGFSPRCMKVPPNWKSLLKSYSKFMPNMVLRCMP